MKTIRYLRFIACLSLLSSFHLAAGTPTTIRLDPRKAVHTMREGFGANLTAIHHSISHDQFNSKLGSEYCDMPHVADTAQWNHIYRLISWSGLDWVRLYVEFNDFEPQRNVFTWDSENFLTLLRWLDWAEAQHVNVLLQVQNVSTTWNVIPGQDGGFSAPANMDDWAHGYVTMVDYLVNTLGYTCITMLNIVNEPNPQWGWWRGRQVSEGYRLARPLLDAKNIRIPFVGTEGGDWNNCKDLMWAREEHEYKTCKYDPPVAAPRTTPDTKYPSLWGEWGLGGARDHTYDWNIRTAKWQIAGVANGNDGYARWSYNNQNDIDGQFSFLRIWDIGKDRLADTIKPQMNLYWVDGLISRYTSKYSTLYASTCDNKNVTVGFFRSPNGGITILVVNLDRNNDAVCNFSFTTLPSGRTLHRYTATPFNVMDREDVIMESSKTIRVGTRARAFTDTVAANSIYAYTTYDLRHTDPGVTWDGEFREPRPSMSARDPIPQAPPAVTARPRPPYPPDFDSTSVYTIVNRQTGDCLEGGDSIAVLSPYTSAASQYWRIVNAGGGYYRMRNAATGKYLDNEGAKIGGTAVILADGAGSDSQLWKIINVGGGYHKCKARGSLITATGFYKPNRIMHNLGRGAAGPEQQTEMNNADQNWRIDPVDPVAVGR